MTDIPPSGPGPLSAPPQQAQPQYRPGGQSTGMAVASMVLGIVSIPTCLSCGVASMVCGILAVVFANKATAAVAAGLMPRSAEGMVRAGKICGTIGIVLSAIAFLGGILYFVFILAVIGTQGRF